MINHKRRKRLLALLNEHVHVSVERLCQWLNASAATVRRDIAWLAERNMLNRVRGGAERLPPTPTSFALSGASFQASLASFPAQKRAIARYAASLCQDGETIIINGGSTTFMMAEFLVHRQLKILTHSFLMAERLLTTSENQIILPGGQVYREQNVILSPFDNDISQHHYASKMFMGSYGLSLLGLMEADPLLIQAEKRLMGQAEQIIVLMDSSKFSRKAGLVLCALSQVHSLITDNQVSDAVVQWLEQAGVQVVTIAPEQEAVLED